MSTGKLLDVTMNRMSAGGRGCKIVRTRRKKIVLAQWTSCSEYIVFITLDGGFSSGRWIFWAEGKEN